MWKKSDIRAKEERVVQLLGEGHSTLEIAKTPGRDHRTIKKVVDNVNKVRTRKTKKFKAKLTDYSRLWSRLSREVKKNLLQTSKQVYDACEIFGVNRTTRCQILSTCSSTKKSPSKPSLTKIHKEKRRAWSVQYLKHDFNLVLFTDKMRTTLDGPDGWSRGLVAHGRAAPTQFKRQQGGDGVMIWAGIIGNELVGPFKVEDGVKIDSAGYT